MENPIKGLSGADAQRILGQVGPNATPDVAIHPLRLVLGKFLAPVSILLEIAIVLQLALGEYIEGSIIGVLLIFNTAIGFFHETRAQSTIAALKSRLALNASVLRDGAWKIVPAAELVPADIVKLSLGTVVAADVRIREGSILLDQSMLTGESLPVEAGPGTETYAGALVRRGEAVAQVRATGVRTKFGRTAELVRTAYVVSTQQKAVFRVVRNLAGFNGAVTLLLMVYAYEIGMPLSEAIPLVLISVLASVPVALPATFTLATAIGARALTRAGVLPTRLSAVDEAASLDVLCMDKTGTLTRNELAVAAIHAMPGFDEARVLALAALASADGGQDPVDAAVRAAAALRKTGIDLPKVTRFVPFDPATKMSEATTRDHDGKTLRIVKGAFAVVHGLSQASPEAELAAHELEKRGHRVLGVAIGTEGAMRVAGIVALSDPPRSDSKPLIDQLRTLGVHTVMVTGDAATTAAFVADAVGLPGAVCLPGQIPDRVGPDDFSVFAGVLPEDKFRLVKAFQNAGHTVGMCGDGANDAPALRQAQIGIAVSTATDVAKSAAGIVLTEPGLAGIVASVREGRITFQRILTYALRSIVHKSRQVLFLGFGLILTKHAILTPMLMVISMITGDFLAMSSTTDNVRPSSRPNSWRIDTLTIVGIVLGLFDLAFCAGLLSFCSLVLHLDIDTLRTMTLVTLAFNGQAVFYVVRERRRLWSSRPSTLVVVSSVLNIAIIGTLALGGILMAPLAPSIAAGILAAAIVLALIMDQVKVWLFARFKMA
ncbi:HAD-IC family P-type ATPase [Bradyrhizobium sp.]|uniref:HAD-IC family P-type ATPase n=1 Tax=Bradyrhizobium sp. TaxID=376 RepID=UPI003D14EF69